MTPDEKMTETIYAALKTGFPAIKISLRELTKKKGKAYDAGVLKLLEGAALGACKGSIEEGMKMIAVSEAFDRFRQELWSKK